MVIYVPGLTDRKHGFYNPGPLVIRKMVHTPYLGYEVSSIGVHAGVCGPVEAARTGGRLLEPNQGCRSRPDGWKLTASSLICIQKAGQKLLGIIQWRLRMCISLSNLEIQGNEGGPFPSNPPCHAALATLVPTVKSVAPGPAVNFGFT